MTKKDDIHWASLDHVHDQSSRLSFVNQRFSNVLSRDQKQNHVCSGPYLEKIAFMEHFMEVLWSSLILVKVNSFFFLRMENIISKFLVWKM